MASNPAFNRGFANAGNGGPGWGAQPQQYGAPTQYDPYAAPSPYAPPTTRYMTMDDVVTKTGISFLVTVLFVLGAMAYEFVRKLNEAFWSEQPSRVVPM